MNTTTVFSQGWIDIVFDGRNKAYGAYELRRIKDRTMILALIFSSGIAAGLGFFSLTSKQSSMPPEITFFPFTVIDTLLAPPVVESSEKPKGQPLQRQEQPSVRDEHHYEIVDSNNLIEPPDTNDLETNAMETDTTASGVEGSLLASVSPDGQLNGKANGMVDAERDEPKDWTDEMPEYPGGYSEMKKFISRNIEYLEIAREYGIEGTVYLSFVVEKDGSVTQVKVVRGIFKPLDEEAVRVVKMMPLWKPGKQNGKPVRVRCKVPIIFAFN